MLYNLGIMGLSATYATFNIFFTIYFIHRDYRGNLLLDRLLTLMIFRTVNQRLTEGLLHPDGMSPEPLYPTKEAVPCFEPRQKL